jgi:TonB family protein
VIRDVVLKNRQKVRDCYDIERRKHPRLKGTLTLHFKLSASGRVSFAEVNQARTTLDNPELATCALKALRTIQFPPSSRGFESEVNYPFDFRP